MIVTTAGRARLMSAPRLAIGSTAAVVTVAFTDWRGARCCQARRVSAAIPNANAAQVHLRPPLRTGHWSGDGLEPVSSNEAPHARQKRSSRDARALPQRPQKFAFKVSVRLIRWPPGIRRGLQRLRKYPGKA